jgi:hypothetical protein
MEMMRISRRERKTTNFYQILSLFLYQFFFYILFIKVPNFPRMKTKIIWVLGNWVEKRYLIFKTTCGSTKRNTIKEMKVDPQIFENKFRNIFSITSKKL